MRTYKLIIYTKFMIVFTLSLLFGQEPTPISVEVRIQDINGEAVVNEPFRIVGPYAYEGCSTTINPTTGDYEEVCSWNASISTVNESTTGLDGKKQLSWSLNTQYTSNQIGIDLPYISTKKDIIYLNKIETSPGCFLFDIKTKWSNADDNIGKTRSNLVYPIPIPQPFATPDNYQYNAYVFYGSGEPHKMNKPLVIVEGIDFADRKYDWRRLYRELSHEVISYLRTIGYDVIFFDYSDGTAPIQLNAALLVDFITQELNPLLNTNGSNENIVMIGASMGGLVSRYALTYLESQNVNHNTKLWVSFDAPQQDANIPLGFQASMNALAHWKPSLSEAKDKLNRPAPQQLLKYHYNWVDKNNSWDTQHFGYQKGLSDGNPHYQVMNEIGLMGHYPNQLRKIAISNGSGDGKNEYTTTKFFKIYLSKDKVSNLAAIVIGAYSLLISPLGLVASVACFWDDDSHFSMEAWSISSNRMNERIADVYAGLDCDIVTQIDYDGYLNAPLINLDDAPGGRRDTFEELEEEDGVEIYRKSHCFIPTVSALDLRTTSGMPLDPYHKIYSDNSNYSQLPSDVYSPFDAVVYQEKNRDHISMEPTDQSNIAFWLFNELDPISLTLTNQTISKWNKYYTVHANIIAENFTVESSTINPTRVDFVSGNSVKLKPGVTIKSGSKFSAKINSDLYSTANISQGGWSQMSAMTKSSESESDMKKDAADSVKTEIPTKPLELPTTFSLDQNYPNPFNPTTTMRYALKKDVAVTLKIYNMLGQEVKTLVNNQKQAAGFKSVMWDGRNNYGHQVPSGTYIYRLQAGTFIQTRKMLLVK